MVEAPLTAERILTTTEDVLRRYGPGKATVLDVARALEVSHGSVYRHFPSKAALREAVTRRWLGRAHHGLAVLAADTELPPAERLAGWLRALFDAKRAKARSDPELFATYSVLAGEQAAVVAEHQAELVDQLRLVVEAGVAAGEFDAPDPAATARAIFDATTRFHHPAHSADWSKAGIDAAFDAVCGLVMTALRVRR